MGQTARLQLSGQLFERRFGEEILRQQAAAVAARDEQYSVDRHKMRSVALSSWTRHIPYLCYSYPSKRITLLFKWHQPKVAVKWVACCVRIRKVVG